MFIDIFRDIEQAYFLAFNGYSKPAVILAGGVIEELLRLYIESKGIKSENNTLDSYIRTCAEKKLLKKAIHKLADSFRELHASVTRPIEVLQKIRKEEPLGVQWQNQVLAEIQLHADIYLVSDLEDKVLKDFMITPIKSVEEGLTKAFSILGDDADITVIPEGPLILPILSC